jgi:uncharacterized cupredoxin-like copper-binding protein
VLCLKAGSTFRKDPRKEGRDVASLLALSARRRRHASAMLLAGLGLFLASCVVQASASPPATRDIRVNINGLHFVPDHFEVRVGETIRFVVSNPTDQPHELFIGTEAEQLAHHREVMNQPPDQQVQLMQHTGYGIYLTAYDSGQFIFHFSEVGEIVIGCHVPGHWEGGMRAMVSVLA